MDFEIRLEDVSEGVSEATSDELLCLEPEDLEERDEPEFDLPELDSVELAAVDLDALELLVPFLEEICFFAFAFLRPCGVY